MRHICCLYARHIKSVEPDTLQQLTCWLLKKAEPSRELFRELMAPKAKRKPLAAADPGRKCSRKKPKSLGEVSDESDQLYF